MQFIERKNGQHHQPTYYSVLQKDRSITELNPYGVRVSSLQPSHVQNLKVVRGMPVQQQFIMDNTNQMHRLPAMATTYVQKELRSSSSQQSLFTNKSQNPSSNPQTTRRPEPPFSPITQIEPQTKPPEPFQPQPINILKKQRIVTNQQIDHKADLQVMRSKYKALQERYEKLEEQIKSLQQHSRSFRRHSRRQTEVNQLVLEDINEEASSQDLIEEILATRIDQELEKFKAENNDRQELIKAKYESYIENLKAENIQLKAQIEVKLKSGSVTPQKTERSKGSDQGVSSLEISLQRVVGQLEAAKEQIRQKDIQIENLKFEAVTSGEKVLHQKSMKQLEKINNQLKQKEHEVQNLQTRINIAESTHIRKSQYQSLLRKLETKTNENQKYMVEIGILQNSFIQKESVLRSLLSEKQKFLQEINKLKNANTNLSSKLAIVEESKIQTTAEIETTQREMKQQIARLEEQKNNNTFDLQQKSEKIRYLDQEVKKYSTILEQTRRQYSQNMKDSDRRIVALKKLTIEQEAIIEQLRIDLEFKRTRPEHDTPSFKKTQAGEVEQLKQQISRLTAEQTQKRVEYENNLRRMRQQCEEAYRETLQIYEQKIEQLSKRRYKSKDKLADDRSIKRVVSQTKFTNNVVGYDELQDRITDFQIRINQLVEDRGADPDMYSSDNALQKLVAQLNARIRVFKSENTKLRNLVANKKQKQTVLKEFSLQNKQLISQKAKHEHSLSLMKDQIRHLRGVIKNYQKAIYELQVGQQMAPPSQRYSSEQRIKILTEKVDFYKQKHRDMETRVKDLLSVNSQLKAQLEQATKNQNKHDNYEHNMAVQNNQKLQEQLRSSQQQLLHLKSEHLLKIQSMERQSQSKIGQLENQIVELNVRIATLKNDKSINENQYKLTKDTLAHRQTLVNELNHKIGQMRRENSELLIDRRKKQELESSLNEALSKINSLTIQKNHLESESSGLKKHVGYVQKQLLTTNEKLSTVSNSHLNSQIELTQAKTTINHLQKRCNQLNLEVKTLQRYRSECDTTANDDRHRMNQLEVRLKDNYYELEKVNKIKQSLEQQINSLKSTITSQKQQMSSAINRSRQQEKEISRLQNENRNEPLLMSLREELARTKQQNILLTTSVHASRFSEQNDYLRSIQQLQIKLENINLQFGKLDQKNKMLESELETERRQRDMVERQAKNRISALEQSLNSLNSNQSTERDNLQVDSLRLKLAESQNALQQMTIRFEKRFQHVNSEFIGKYHLMERHYLSQIGQLTNELENFKKNKFSVDVVESCLHFIQKVRAMCHELFGVVRQVYSKLDPVQGMPNILEQYAEAIELSCQELISQYASELPHVDQVIQK